jgi:predicted ATP-grasp superfamily ATP-dependent carboligase
MTSVSPAPTDSKAIGANLVARSTPSLSAGHRPLSVLLLDEDGHHSQKVAVCLGQIKNIKLHVLSNRPWVPVRFSRHVATFQWHDPGATDGEKLETVLRAIDRTQSDVLLPVMESGFHFMAAHQSALASRISLPPVPDASALKLGRDKALLKDFLVKHDLPHPSTVVLRTIKQAEADLACLTFPVLFKPATGSGGSGIRIFVDSASLFSFLQSQWRAEYPALLQSYIHGHDVDCSVLCKNGNIVAQATQVSLLQRRQAFGADEAIEFMEDPAALEATAQLMHALKWNGVAHVDLRRDARNGNRVNVLDFNPRYWTSLLGSLGAGVNFPYLSCLAALGHEFDPPKPSPRKFFTAEAVVRHVAWKCVGRGHGVVTLRESGLPYALSDPLPRAFGLAIKGACSLANAFKKIPHL